MKVFFLCGQRGLSASSRDSVTNIFLSVERKISRPGLSRHGGIRLSRPYVIRRLAEVDLLSAHLVHFIYSVGREGLEPSILAEPVPKTGVYTIPPSAHWIIILCIYECCEFGAGVNLPLPAGRQDFTTAAYEFIL